jgi:hypothetical protein
VPIDFGFEGPATIDFGFEGPAEQPKKKQPDWRDAEAASNLEAMQGPRPQDPGDMEVRGNVLPIARNVETGRISPAIPKMVTDPLTLPGDVYTGKTDPNSDEGIQRALGFAGGVTLASKFGGAPKQTPISTSKGMPRASVRDQDELLGTGGNRIEEAKLNPSKVEADLLQAPMKKFRESTKTQVIENKTVNNIAKRLEKAYTPRKPDEMSRLTKVQPPERPPVTLTELHAHQQRLDDVINGPGKSKVDGRLNSEGRAAIELKKSVGEMIDAHPESGSFKIGKHEYHRGKQSQELSDLLERAQRRRTWQNGDEAGALNAEIAQFLNKKSNRYKFTKAQRIELENIGKRDAQALLGAFGSKTVGGQAFGRGLETMVFGFPGALAVPGHFARVDRNAKVIDLFKKFQEKIRAGGPIR